MCPGVLSLDNSSPFFSLEKKSDDGRQDVAHALPVDWYLKTVLE
jgi:hypothetical protein